MATSGTRRAHEGSVPGTTSDTIGSNFPNIVSFRAEVSHDGDEAVLHVSREGATPYIVGVPYKMMGIVSHEIR